MAKGTMNAEKKLIVALDILDEKKCLEMIDVLSPSVDIFKIGIAPFTGFGQRVLDKIEAMNKKTFLDLKFHDIPNTVYNAAYIATKKNIFMMNFHCLGSGAMLREAARGARECAEKEQKELPILLGVTVLTSMGEQNLREIGIDMTVEEAVRKFAVLAGQSGMQGVVASPRETALIKKELGEKFIVVTPGIRPSWAGKDDQKRITTPKEAMENGADYIVVGRPIIKDKEPLQAAKRILEEMGQ